MNNSADLYHNFPTVVDNYIDASNTTYITGGDGVLRYQVQIPGTINGTRGVFDYIIDLNGWCNHRCFKKEAK